MLTRRHVVTALGSLAVQSAAINGAPAQNARRFFPVLQEQEPILVAVVPFTGTQAGESLAARLSQVIEDDLTSCRLFRLVDPAASRASPLDFDAVPPAKSLQALHADAVVVGRVKELDDGRISVEFRLWAARSGYQLAGQRYAAPRDGGRRVAHIVADQIYQRLLGDKGYFDSRIAFIEGEGGQRRPGRLVVMDRDGANSTHLTSYGAAMWPRFSSVGNEIGYLQWEAGAQRLALLNLVTGQSEILGRLPGLSVSPPGFSPDGKRMAVSIAQDGRASLFAIDLDSKSFTRLTEAPASDVSPYYAPDGSRVCFTSNRDGAPEIYVMPAHGGEARRISSGGGGYSTPIWSPAGDAIAFTRRIDGQVAIGIMKTDGSGERILASGVDHEECPTFAPNGRTLMFSRESGANAGPSLYTIDVSGRFEQKVPTPGYASDPAWSPLLS
ncbi:Tol-Pal system protein TolB [Bradyrhizobium sp. USDA 4353]